MCRKEELVSRLKKGVAEEEIWKDTDIYYRVLNLQNPFNDTRTSYFHKSLGGYHGAKLRRYNEVAMTRIIPEMRKLTSAFRTPEKIDSIMQTLPVINMLNTKYFIYSENNPPIPNNVALGNVWLINSVKMVENADQEIAAIEKFNPQEQAIVDKRFENLISKKEFNPEGSSIKLTEYQPDYLKYEANLNGEQLAVFSEIYYPKGWNAFVDGKPIEHFRVNYILRAAMLPSGKHEIEFRFRPKSYYMGNKVSFASSLLLILAIAGFLFFEIKKLNHETRKTTEA